MLLYDSDLQKRSCLYGMTHCYVTKARVALSTLVKCWCYEGSEHLTWRNGNPIDRWLPPRLWLGQERAIHRQEYGEGNVQVNPKRRPAVHRCEGLGHLRQRLSSIRECHWDGIFAKEGKEMGLGRVEGGYDAFPAKASDKPMWALEPGWSFKFLSRGSKRGWSLYPSND